MADISAQIGTRKDIGEDDTTSVDKESAPAEFLASVQSIQGALAEAHLEDVYESLCWLGSWRPESNTYLTRIQASIAGFVTSWLPRIRDGSGQVSRIQHNRLWRYSTRNPCVRYRKWRWCGGALLGRHWCEGWLGGARHRVAVQANLHPRRLSPRCLASVGAQYVRRAPFVALDRRGGT